MTRDKLLKKKLSIRGIFIFYGCAEIVRSVAFWLALSIMIIYVFSSILIGNNQKDFTVFIINKIEALFPNLIGFSLGGYAIIVSFGNTDFLKTIAKSGQVFYERLNAVFAFSILTQVLVLFTSFTTDVFTTVFDKSQNHLSYLQYQSINLCFNAVFLFLTSWSLILIIYVVSNIFIFGETHHELLKNQK
jgi:hypothetical protein